MGYDPSELNESAENAPDNPNSAEITEIRETTAGEVFPESVELDDPTKPMIEVVAETSDGVNTPVRESFSLPQNDAAWNNPQFKLGQFRDYYGKVPEPGMSVDVQMNEENGILEIVY